MIPDRRGAAARILGFVPLLLVLGLPACREAPYEPPPPPTVTITNPSTTSGRYGTFLDRIRIDGTVSKATIVRWINDTSQQHGVADLQGRAFSADIGLILGTNLITFYADADGRGTNVGRVTIRVTFDPDIDLEPPQIAITFPTTGSSWDIDQAIVVMAGFAGDNSGSFDVLWANRATGESGVAAGRAQWQVSSRLVPGENLIVVTARDRGANLGSDSLRVDYIVPPQAAQR